MRAFYLTSTDGFYTAIRITDQKTRELRHLLGTNAIDIDDWWTSPKLPAPQRLKPVEGMTYTGWTPIKTICDLELLRGLLTEISDILLIDAAAGVIG